MRWVLYWPQSLLDDRRTAWAIGLLALALFAVGNLPWQLDDYDQAKQAFTSFQMVNQNRWFYQTTPHAWIATKPPLVGWISAALFYITRWWEFAWRAPSFLASVAIGILVFRLTRSAYGATAAAIALAAFSLNLLTPRLATLARTDMALALVVFLVGAKIWNKIRERQPWRPNDNLLVFLLLTAGMLIKGPVVWAFLLPGIVIYLALRRRTNVNDFGGWWPWIASLLVFSAWVAAGIRFVPGFYDQVVVREFLGRFGGEAHRAQPLFFYLPHLLHKFAPWSLLMLGLGILELRATGWQPKKWNVSPETVWLICWSFGGLAVMSLLPSKRVDRIFPVIPPLCLLLGAQIRSAVSRSARTNNLCRWTAAVLAFAVLLTSGYVVSKVRAGYRQHLDALVRFGEQVRQQAAARHLRYAAVSAPAESLLLYLRQTHFLLPARAAAQWNSGQLDGLVVSVADLSELSPQLTPPGVIALQSQQIRGDPNSQYVLVTKGQ
jgi:4-amino-4-deoxy-L-arabinose transferase-like glycosyltransferase